MKTNLYYGDGICSIEGSNIMGVQIKYKGAIELDDKTSDAFFLAERNNTILIVPLRKGTLTNLFEYQGEFRILSAVASDNNGYKINVNVNKVMDYSELLNINAEDLVVNSESLKSSFIHKKKINKSVLRQRIIPNLHTSDGTDLFLKDGAEYHGDYHIHIGNGNTFMTGHKHSKDSQDLYFRNERTGKYIATRNFKLKRRK